MPRSISHPLASPAILKVHLPGAARLWRLALALILLLPLLAIPSPAYAATLPVTTCNASDLIAAINTANGNGQADTITLAAGCTYSFNTVNNYWYGPNALPAIASNITIEGNGAVLEISGVTRLRFFFVGADGASTRTLSYYSPGAGVLTLRNLTLQGGIQQGGNTYKYGGSGAGMGGAIFNQGMLVLEAVTLFNNAARGGSINTTTTTTPAEGGGMGVDSQLRNLAGGFGGDFSLGSSGAGGSGNYSGGGGGFRGSDNAGAAPAAGGTTDGLGGVTRTNGTHLGGRGSGAGVYLSTGAYLGSGGGFGRGGQNRGYAGTYGAGGGGGVGGGGGGGGYAGGAGGFGGGGGGVYDTTYVAEGGAGGFGGGGGYPNGPGGFGGGAGGSWGGGGGAGMGGAIFNHGGVLLITNSTLTGNTAQGGSGAGIGQGLGGAVFNLNGSVTIANSTLAGNTVATPYSSGTGGALYNLRYTLDATIPDATVTIQNSILANSSSGSDLLNNAPANLVAASGGGANTGSASVTFQGQNLVRSLTNQGNATSSGPAPLTADPLLGALAHNGGFTWTMAPQPGSPAIGAGDNATCTAVDQRGYSRPQPAGGVCDLGALEDAVCTWTGNGSDLWQASANWNINVTPGSTDTCHVPSGLATYPVIRNAAEIGTLVVEPGATVTLNGGALSLAQATIQGTLTVANSETITVTSGWDIPGTFNPGAGTVVVDGALALVQNAHFHGLTIPAGKSLTAGAYTLAVGGGFANHGTFTTSSDAAVGTVFSGPAINAGVWNDGGGRLTFDGAFTNQAGVAFTPSSNAAGTTFRGATLNAGLWNAGSGSLAFQGTFTNGAGGDFTPGSSPAGTIFGAATFNQGTWKANTGPVTFQAAFTNQAGATFTAGSGPLSFFDVFLETGSLFNAGSANISVRHDWTTAQAPVFAAGTGTVTFDGVGAQNLNMAYWVGTPTAILHPTDSFESWSGGSPAGWTEQALYLPGGGSADWYADGQGAPGGGIHSAGFAGYGGDCSTPPYCADGSSAARIFTTTPFATAGYSSCTVQFNFVGYEPDPLYNGYKCLQIEGSSDGVNFGAVGSPICTDSGGYGWAQKTVGLGSYTGRPAVWLGLKGTDMPSAFGFPSSGDFSVDLLRVECLLPALNGKNQFNNLVVGENSVLAAAGELPLTGNLTINPNGTLTAGGNVAVSGDLLLDADGKLNIGSHTLAVDGGVANYGALQQTLNVTGPTEFLHIQNAAGSADKYFGLVITPTLGSMLTTTVIIQGNQDSCTQEPTDPLLTRCFNITPTTPVNATIRFYFTQAERNGQAANRLKLWHWSPGWQMVGGNYRYSESGIQCMTGMGLACWFQAENVASYSPFGLSASSIGPTAIELAELRGRTPPGVSLAGLLALIAALGAAAFSLGKRRKNPSAK